MSTRRTTHPRRTGLRNLIPILVLLLLAFSGIGGTLWGTGYFEKQSVEISREGQLAFPALSRAVRAYDAITRADLLHPETGQLNVIWIAEAQAQPSMIRDLSQIIGRVVSRDKSPGYILTERDLLPAGTRPGISAGIPPGKRSVSVPVTEVPGIELLQQGDMFDLMAVLPQRDKSDSVIEQAALLGGIKPPDTRSGQLARQTGIKPLVIAGTMVAITQGKSRSTDGAQGLVVPPSQSRTARSPEVVATIAVDPVEVEPLTEAIGLDVKLYCIARSGHPQDRPVEEQKFSTDGLIPVLTLARPVSAFSEITQEDLADPVTGRLNVYYFRPDRVAEDWVTDFSKLNGRVVARNLSRGAVIAETDLMPVGTRPGVVGAIPVGMEAVFVDSERVIGLDRLLAGDRFEIHSRLPEKFAPSATKPMAATIYGGRLSDLDQARQDELKTGMRVLSRSALLLQTPGTAGDRKVSIAVAHDEARALLQAIQMDHELFAIGRSDEAPVEPKDDAPDSVASSARISQAAEAAPGSVSLVAQTRPGEDPTVETGKVLIPILVTNVNPRTRMSVDEFIEPSTGRVRFLEFDREQVPGDVVTELREILGRRAGRQLYAGEWVLRGDLCEQQQWNVPCDIPAGWSVMELTSLDVRGLEIAEVGDLIDLVAVRPIASLDLQAKAEWPLRRSDATFQQSTREDVFTQSDVVTLATQAHVVGSSKRQIFVPVIEQKEAVGSEKQLGDIVERESVQKTRTTSFLPVEATVFQVAVPLKSVVPITEALTIKSIETDQGGNARNNAGTPDGRGNTNRESGPAQTSQEFVDHEVAIYAVLRSPNSTDDLVIPQRDIVAQWMKTWGQRFSKFVKSEREQAKAVRSIQHIRGTSITEDYWINGNPSTVFPYGAVHSRTVERQIDRQQDQGDR